MMIIVVYDIKVSDDTGPKRLSQVAKKCKNYGQRVQNSVFECDIDWAQYLQLKKELLDIIDKDKDSIRIYRIGNKYDTKIENYGCKDTYDPEGELIF